MTSFDLKTMKTPASKIFTQAASPPNELIEEEEAPDKEIIEEEDERPVIQAAYLEGHE